jgi:hypothetical protein
VAAGSGAADELGATRGCSATDEGEGAADGVTDEGAASGALLGAASGALLGAALVAVVARLGNEPAGAVDVLGVGGAVADVVVVVVVVVVVAGDVEVLLLLGAVVDDVGDSGGVVGVSDGTVEPEGSDVAVVSEVPDVVDVVDVVDVSVDDVGVLDVDSIAGTGSQVSGEDGSTGSGSPGASVAAGSCSTTLYVNAFHCSTSCCLLST